MRKIAVLGLLAALGLLGCPGTARDFSVPDKDADTPVPDAAVNVEAGPPVPVRVVNWNTQNFYNDKRDSLEVPVADEIVLTSQEYQQKLSGIAGVLTSLTPDVIVIEEIENQAVMDDLGDALGGYPNRHITQGNDPRGIDIAILSKFPITSVVSHKDEFFKASTDPSKTFVFARDVLEAHMVINGRQVVFFGVHWKSGTDADSQLKRIAEAEQTKKIVQQVEFDDPTTFSIVLGDFNSDKDTPQMAALKGTDLVSATEIIPVADRWSVDYGSKMLFDDQIIDSSAAGGLDAEYPAKVNILHSGTVNALSDHSPVLATYLVN